MADHDRVSHLSIPLVFDITHSPWLYHNEGRVATTFVLVPVFFFGSFCIFQLDEIRLVVL